MPKPTEGVSSLVEVYRRYADNKVCDTKAGSPRVRLCKISYQPGLSWYKTDLVLVRPECPTMLYPFALDHLNHFRYTLLWRDDPLHFPR